MADLLDFSWDVVTLGYEWLETTPTQVFGRQKHEIFGWSDNCFLVVREPHGEDALTAGWRSYQPLVDHKELFQIFALTQPSRSGILAFANKYGELKSRNQAVLEVSESRQVMAQLGKRFYSDNILRSTIDMVAGYEKSILADPLSVWIEQIDEMYFAFEIWSSLNKRDEERLKGFFSWRGDSIEVRHPRHSGVVFIQILSPRLGGPRITHGDLLQAARLYLTDLITRNMNGLVSPQLLPSEGFQAATLRIVPTCLIGAMWLQFAQAVDRTRSYKQCEACGKWFDVSDRFGARADKKTCDVTCRMRLSRKLAREGKVAKPLPQNYRRTDKKLR